MSWQSVIPPAPEDGVDLLLVAWKPGRSGKMYVRGIARVDGRRRAWFTRIERSDWATVWERLRNAARVDGFTID